uniref:Methyltransferase type 12 domain-containing protein n=1 Tax=Kalanchoe fedtschenkoi TaxID=63787 RepID=A0A7N0UAS2_KALFE
MGYVIRQTPCSPTELGGSSASRGGGAAGFPFPAKPLFHPPSSGPFLCFLRPPIRSGRRNNGSKYWDKFYKRHNNKFFKDRHYLEKDWGSYFSQESDDASSSGKVVLEVGCGAGNTVYPLLAGFPGLFVHACDFSPEAISLVKSHKDFNTDRINAFVCDVTKDDLTDKILPSSVDILTLVFVLSAVSPEKMHFILRNAKKVLKPMGCVLLRDYAVGDFAQAKLESKNQAIGENFYVRGDGTSKPFIVVQYSYFFSQDMMLNLFRDSGYNNLDINVYCKQIENRSRGVTMERRWIRAIFSSIDNVQEVNWNHKPTPLTHVVQ